MILQAPASFEAACVPYFRLVSGQSGAPWPFTHWDQGPVFCSQDIKCIKCAGYWIWLFIGSLFGWMRFYMVFTLKLRGPGGPINLNQRAQCVASLKTITDCTCSTELHSLQKFSWISSTSRLVLGVFQTLEGRGFRTVPKDSIGELRGKRLNTRIHAEYSAMKHTWKLSCSKATEILLVGSWQVNEMNEHPFGTRGSAKERGFAWTRHMVQKQWSIVSLVSIHTFECRSCLAAQFSSPKLGHAQH